MRRHSLPENKKMTMGLFRRLAREAKPIWPAILFSCLLNLVIIACSILTPELTGQVTDKIMGYFETGAPANLLAEIRPSLLLLLGAYVIFGLTRLFNMYCMNNVVSRHFTCAIRIKMSDKIQRLPVKFVDGTPVGQILERMTDDVSAMGNSVHNVVDTFIGGILQIIAISVALLLEDWRLGLIVLAAIPVSVVLSAQLSQRSRKYHRATFREAAQAYSITEEAYTNFATTKAYNLEASLIEKHKEITDTQAEYREKAAFIGGLVRPVITFANNLTFILVNLLGGWLAIQGKIPLSAVVTVVLFARQFATPLERIANGFTMLQRTAAASERVFHMLDLPEEDPRAGAVEPQAVQGEVVFDRVKFAYDPDRPLIDNLSFTATPGQTVAIVGPTGAGKTTIVNLLMSFYDILEGEIRIDGRPLSQMSRDEARELFAMVLQETWLFRGTVAENVAYGKPGATREEIIQACDEAYCDHFIRTLPQGYDTVIGDESATLSGGQKQLLTIARAVLSDRRLLILDEATSNVDTRTEILIQKAMDKLMKGRTCFVIAHRLSTIVNSDRILVLDDGKIIEQGTHQELLAKKGFYYKLYRSQYEGAEAE